MKKKLKVKRGASRRKVRKPKRKTKPVVLVTWENIDQIRSMKGVIFEAYKASRKNGASPCYPADDSSRVGPVLTCKAGAVLKVPRKLVDLDEAEHCGAGVNVATAHWVIKSHGGSPNRRRRNTLWAVRFTPKDIAAIPGNGRWESVIRKFRLFQCKVHRKVRWADVAKKHNI